MDNLKPVSFFVPGKAIGKGRMRLSTMHGFARMHPTDQTINYEGLVAVIGTEAMAGRALLAGPVMVEMRIVCAIPQSKSKKWKAMALAGEVMPTKKPDLDNVVKSIFDGLNGITWNDDVQAVDLHVRKRFGETPGVHVRIVPLVGESS